MPSRARGSIEVWHRAAGALLILSAASAGQNFKLLPCRCFHQVSDSPLAERACAATGGGPTGRRGRACRFGRRC